jgi:prefoldin subunit 5
VIKPPWGLILWSLIRLSIVVCALYSVYYEIQYLHSRFDAIEEVIEIQTKEFHRLNVEMRELSDEVEELHHDQKEKEKKEYL